MLMTLSARVSTSVKVVAGFTTGPNREAALDSCGRRHGSGLGAQHLYDLGVDGVERRLVKTIAPIAEATDRECRLEQQLQAWVRLRPIREMTGEADVSPESLAHAIGADLAQGSPNPDTA
jgi:hypothetical protein